MKLLFTPFTSKNRRGFSLIEVSMVLAISALLLVGALGFIRNGDRRAFDDSMQTVLAQIREVQGEANQGIGPDPKLYNCDQLSAPPTPSDPTGFYSPIGSLLACPFAPYGASHNLTTYSFGRAISFGHNAVDARFTDAVAGGQTLTTNYFTYTLGIKPHISPNVFSVEANPVVHSLPPGIGFQGYCRININCPALNTTNAVTTVFSRASLSTADAAGLPTNSAPSGTAMTRMFPLCEGFSGITTACNSYSVINGGTCTTAIPNPGYFDMYANTLCDASTPAKTLISQNNLMLRFSDLKTGTYLAQIVINTTDNSVSLLTQ